MADAGISFLPLRLDQVFLGSLFRQFISARDLTSSGYCRVRIKLDPNSPCPSDLASNTLVGCQVTSNLSFWIAIF